MEDNNVKKTAEKVNSLVYRFTKFDNNGWADAKTASPIPFDLVTIETKSNKKIIAWWNTVSWKGLHLDDKDLVLRWRKRSYERFS